MAIAISVRLDDDTTNALDRLKARTGVSRSEAIRSAILAAAAQLNRRSSLTAEVAALEADEADVQEMREIAGFMESMRAPG